MGKAKRRSLQLGTKNKFQYMTRESALNNVIKNMDNKNLIKEIILITIGTYLMSIGINLFLLCLYL